MEVNKLDLKGADTRSSAAREDAPFPRHTRGRLVEPPRRSRVATHARDPPLRKTAAEPRNMISDHGFLVSWSEILTGRKRRVKVLESCALWCTAQKQLSFQKQNSEFKLGRFGRLLRAVGGNHTTKTHHPLGCPALREHGAAKFCQKRLCNACMVSALACHEKTGILNTGGHDGRHFRIET